MTNRKLYSPEGQLVELFAQADRIRPVRSGCQVSHHDGLPGTLGALVKFDSGGGPLALSCSHVLARSGFANVDDLVIQPWSGAPAGSDSIGRLNGDFSILSPKTVNAMDAAIAELNELPGTLGLFTGTRVESVFQGSASDFPQGMATILNGSVTQGAFGTVIGALPASEVRDIPFVGTILYSGLVAYNTSNSGGDSGAAVVSADGSMLLGLHIGGSTVNNIGVFHPIGPIFSHFGVDLWQPGT